jgi:hypothetical protein
MKKKRIRPGTRENTSNQKGEKMKTNVFAVIITLVSSFLPAALPADADQALKAAPAGGKGYLELECNIAGVDLHLCPLNQFERKKKQWFFGLLTAYQESCTGEELFLGTTPLRPLELPEGSYVLLIPPNYTWEHKGQIEVSVAERQKTFFLLKLFKRFGGQENGGPDVPGGAPSGSGTGGTVGTSPSPP